MSNFTDIKIAIDDVTSPASQAIQAYYDGETTFRKFLAYVLGKSHTKGGGGPHECVLGYQYEGPHTSAEDAKKWRCFKVALLASLSRIDLVPPSSTLTIPPPLNADQVKWQNCVDIPGGRVVRAAVYHP